MTAKLINNKYYIDKNELEQCMEKNLPPENKDFVPRGKILKEFNISQGQLRALYEKGQIKIIRTNQQVFYCKSDVGKFINQKNNFNTNEFITADECKKQLRFTFNLTRRLRELNILKPEIKNDQRHVLLYRKDEVKQFKQNLNNIFIHSK